MVFFYYDNNNGTMSRAPSILFSLSCLLYFFFFTFRLCIYAAETTMTTRPPPLPPIYRTTDKARALVHFIFLFLDFFNIYLLDYMYAPLHSATRSKRKGRRRRLGLGFKSQMCLEPQVSNVCFFFFYFSNNYLQIDCEHYLCHITT